MYNLLGEHIGKKTALAAIAKIDDLGLLSELAQKAVNKSARAEASRKRSILETGTTDEAVTPSPEESPAVEPVPAIDDQVTLEQQQKELLQKIEERQELCIQISSLSGNHRANKHYTD